MTKTMWRKVPDTRIRKATIVNLIEQTLPDGNTKTYAETKEYQSMISLRNEHTVGDTINVQAVWDESLKENERKISLVEAFITAIINKLPEDFMQK